MKLSSSFFKPLSQYSLLGAISVLMITDTHLWFLKPSEILFFVAVTAGFFYLVPNNLRLLKLIDKKIYGALAVFFVSPFLASFISYIRYGISLDTYGALFILRFLLCLVVLFLVLLYSKENSRFFWYVLCALLAPLVFIITLTFPDWAHLSLVFRGNGRFYGASEPVITAASLLVAFSIVWGYFLHTFPKKKLLASLFFVLSTGSAGLILWTLTRGHWLGLGAAALFLAWIYAQKSRKVLRVATNILLTVIMFASAFFILPTSIKSAVLLRVYVQYNLEFWNKNSDLTALTAADLSELLFKIDKDTTRAAATTILQSEQRPKMWYDYSRILLQNPLGLGLNRPSDTMLQAVRTTHRAAHNTLLDMGAWGGIGSIGAFLYLVFLGGSNIRKKLSPATEWDRTRYAVVGAALLGLFIASMFDGLTFLKFIWVVLGLSLA